MIKFMCSYASYDIVTNQQTPSIYSNSYSRFFITFPRFATSVLLSHWVNLFLINRSL